MFYDAVLRLAQWLPEAGSLAQEAMEGQIDAYIAVLDATPRADRILR